MAAFDATEALTPYRADRGYGAILFDRAWVRQADAHWFDPAWWGDRARPVDSGGRGSAWFITAPFGDVLLRQYRRGGLIARLSRERYVWRGPNATRSFAEFRLTRQLAARGLPVARPVAATYQRDGLTYTAAIVLERLPGVRTLAERVAIAGTGAPWEESGRLVARFHRNGLDHADLNAHNLLFDDANRGWLIDFDRCHLRIPETAWRIANLDRLRRSLQKIRGERSEAEVDDDFKRLRRAYDTTWDRGY